MAASYCEISLLKSVMSAFVDATLQIGSHFADFRLELRAARRPLVVAHRWRDVIEPLLPERRVYLPLVFLDARVEGCMLAGFSDSCLSFACMATPSGTACVPLARFDAEEAASFECIEAASVESHLFSPSSSRSSSAGRFFGNSVRGAAPNVKLRGGSATTRKGPATAKDPEALHNVNKMQTRICLRSNYDVVLWCFSYFSRTQKNAQHVSRPPGKCAHLQTAKNNSNKWLHLAFD